MTRESYEGAAGHGHGDTQAHMSSRHIRIQGAKPAEQTAALGRVWRAPCWTRDHTIGSSGRDLNAAMPVSVQTTGRAVSSGRDGTTAQQHTVKTSLLASGRRHSRFPVTQRVNPRQVDLGTLHNANSLIEKLKY